MMQTEKLIVVGLLILMVGVVLFLLAFFGLTVRPAFYIIFMGGGCLLTLMGIVWTGINNW